MLLHHGLFTAGIKAQDQDPAVYVRPQEGVKSTPATMTLSNLAIPTPLNGGPDLVGCDSGGRSRVTHYTEKATATLCGGQTVPADWSTVPCWSWILGMILWYQSSLVCRDPISSLGHWTSYGWSLVWFQHTRQEADDGEVQFVTGERPEFQSVSGSGVPISVSGQSEKDVLPAMSILGSGGVYFQPIRSVNGSDESVSGKSCGEQFPSGVPPWVLNRDFGAPVVATKTVAGLEESRVVDVEVGANDDTVGSCQINCTVPTSTRPEPNGEKARLNSRRSVRVQ